MARFSFKFTCGFTPTYVELSGPLGYGKYRAVNLYEYVRSHIVLLLYSCSPSTVIRCIATVVVYAVYAVFGRRAKPHVRYKISRARDARPPFANRDPASSVARILNGVKVSTPSDDTFPCGVFRRSGQSVFPLAFRCAFSAETAATLGTSSFEVAPRNYTFRPTVAHTVPMRIVVPYIRRPTYDCKPGEPFSDECSITGGCDRLPLATPAAFGFAAFKWRSGYKAFCAALAATAPLRCARVVKNSPTVKFLTCKVDELCHAIILPRIFPDRCGAQPGGKSGFQPLSLVRNVSVA